MPLYSNIEEIVRHFEANIASADALTKGLSRAQFNWRAEARRWSIAECVGHLNLINGQDLERLDAAMTAGRAKGLTGSGPYRYGWLSRKFVNLMEPGAPKKFSAPKQYVPPPDVAVDVTMSEYRRIVKELIQVAQKSRGLDLLKIKTGLSGIPVLKMPLGARLSLIATHDSRHLAQAAEVRKNSEFPAT